jgi:hypothetical protein
LLFLEDGEQDAGGRNWLMVVKSSSSSSSSSAMAAVCRWIRRLAKEELLIYGSQQA